MIKLSAHNISKTYSGKEVVNNISLEVNQGEIVGLLGPNGAGKTTSFYIMVGLVKSRSGQVFLDKSDITSYINYKLSNM